MTVVRQPTSTMLRTRPSYEGANIRTWVGFKHFLYLVEEGVLDWLRAQGTGARELFHGYGLGAEIVDCSAQFPAPLEIDDLVSADVVPAGGNRLRVRLLVDRAGDQIVVLRGTVTLALIPERAAGAHEVAPPPLDAFQVTEFPRGNPEEIAIPAGSTAAGVLAEPGSPALVWSWRAPYFYCHFSDRVQHSGFVRALEEAVERYLHRRQISVATLLAERSWIPVVSRVRVRMLAEVHMEETVHTTFTVTDVLRATMFGGRMRCFVQRGERLVEVAEATILHGYAVSGGPQAGHLARLDPATIESLLGAGHAG